jgi:hypothetical protein
MVDREGDIHVLVGVDAQCCAANLDDGAGACHRVDATSG